MNTEDRLRELFRVDPQDWPHADWRETRSRARRSQRARVVVTVTLIAALVVGGVFLGTHLGRRPSGFVKRPSSDLIVPIAALRFRTPDGWRTKTETPDSYYTATAPKAGESSSPFDVGILFEQPRDFADVFARAEGSGTTLLRNLGVTVTKMHPLIVATHRAEQLRLTFPDTDLPQSATNGTYWCRRCVDTVTFVDWPMRSMLLVRVNANAAHSSDIDAMTRDILSRIDLLDLTSMTTPHGVVRAAVEMSPATNVLVRFLEARVAGSGAEAFVRNPAWLAKHPELYRIKPDCCPVSSYEITAEVDARGGLAYTCAKALCRNYSVTLFSGTAMSDETITMTDDGTGPWVLVATPAVTPRR